MAQVLPYHRRLLCLLQAQPARGDGHRWLFTVAVHLRHYHAAEAVFTLLRRCADQWTDRRVPDAEIRRAVESAFAARLRPAAPALGEWPAAAPDAIERAVRTPPFFSLRPTPLEAGEILPRLFRPGELVCVGYRSDQAFTVSLGNALDMAPKCQFVVPSPMTARTGRTAAGDNSTRCLDNTAPRRFLVVESDGLTKEEQIRILCHLHRFVPLTLAVDSGGKSVHGWFDVEGRGEPAARIFFAYAVRLGADRHTWTRCQFVRMPGGLRDMPGGAQRQSILYASADLF